MPPRTNGGLGGLTWFRVPHTWEVDEALIGLTDTSKLLFLRILGFSDSIGSDGVLTGAQLLHLTAKGARGRQAVERLLCSGALSVVGPLLPGCPSDATPMSVRCGAVVDSLFAGCGSVVISSLARWLPVVNQPATISAGQNKNRAPKKADVEPRAGARQEIEREREREEGRTPSGSVRPSSAPAAPRVAGGATQPALEDQEMSGVAPEENLGTLSRSESLALARANIVKGQKNNPASKGISTQFSRYDPNRPIVPINSAFRFDEDSE